MAALQCEICGGKLVAKADGIFECDSCGMVFEKERVIQMVHEIKGTVKVEKTLRLEQNINVSGTVKVDGGLNAANYIKRGELALKDRKWDAAKIYFHQALDYEPENGEAYLGLAKADMKLMTDRMIGDLVESGKLINNANYRKAMKFSKTLADRYAPYEKAYYKRKADNAAAVQAKKEAEAAQREEEALSLEKKYSANASKYNRCSGMISACKDFTVGVRADGTIVTTPGQELTAGGMENWSEMIAVAADDWYVVGLRADGTVRMNRTPLGQDNCDYVRSWTNVVAIATGDGITMGLKSDGTVYLGGGNYGLQKTVESWKDIRAVSVDSRGSVYALRTDGHVLTASNEKYEAVVVPDWKNIIAINAGTGSVAALDDAGNIYRKGLFSFDEYKRWTDIVSVCAGTSHLIGLKADGTVVSAGKNEYGACNVQGWRNVVSVVTTPHHTVGLCKDGKVVATKFITDGIYTDEGQSKVDDWRLFMSLETMDKEREVGFPRAKFEAQQRKEKVSQELSQLKQELPTIKGLFSGGRRKKVEARIEELEEILKGF